MAKIEVAVIEDEGGATHVKQTWTFKYGNRKRDLLSHLEKHHGFGALSDGDAIVSSDDFLEVGKYNYHGYQQVPPAGCRVGTLGDVTRNSVSQAARQSFLREQLRLLAAASEEYSRQMVGIQQGISSKLLQLRGPSDAGNHNTHDLSKNATPNDEHIQTDF